MSSLLSPVSQKCTDPSSMKGQTLMQSSLMPSELQVPIAGAQGARGSSRAPKLWLGGPQSWELHR